MSAADHHIDVQLGFTVEGVEVVAACGLFHINIDSSSGICGGGHIVAVHTASQIVNSIFQVTLSHTEAVGSTCNQFSSHIHAGSVGDHRGITLCTQDPGVLHLGIAAEAADMTVQSDGIANSRLGNQLIETGVAVLGPGTVDHQLAGAVGDVHITVGGVFDRNDLTGDVVLTIGVSIVILATANGNSVGNGQLGAGSGIGNCCGRLVVNTADQHTACAELDGAVVVGDLTGNGDLVIDVQLVNAVTLHTVALDGIAVGVHGNGDVTVFTAITFIHKGNGAGQSAVIGQGVAGSQSISLLQNIQGILGSYRSCAAAAFHGLQDTAGSELDLAIVVHKATGNGNSIANSQLVCAVALQTIAHNGHILCAGNFDGDSDVLVRGIIGSLDGLDHTDHGVGAFQGLTGSQSICLLDDVDGFLIDGSRNDVVPADAQLTAVQAGDGSGQHISSGLSAFLEGFLVDVDGVGTIVILDDLQDILRHINRPDDIVGGDADANSTQTGIVHGGLLCSILIECAQILNCLLQLQIRLSLLSDLSGLGSNVGGLSFASGKYA